MIFIISCGFGAGYVSAKNVSANGIKVSMITKVSMVSNDDVTIMDKPIKISNNVWSKIFNMIVIFLLLFIASLSVWGIVLCFITNFYKGYTIGFAFSIILNNYGFNGFIFYTATILPQTILYIFIIIYVSVWSVKNTTNKSNTKIINRKPYKASLILYIIVILYDVLIVSTLAKWFSFLLS